MATGRAEAYRGQGTDAPGPYLVVPMERVVLSIRQ
jgi:hypothetical protein